MENLTRIGHSKGNHLNTISFIFVCLLYTTDRPTDRAVTQQAQTFMGPL